MSEIGSLFIATAVLAFGGLGLYMLKSDDNSEEENNSHDNNDEENKEQYKEENLFENESEWFQSNKENKKGKNIKTRRSRKPLKTTRRRM
jgi:hypothetical protein